MSLVAVSSRWSVSPVVTLSRGHHPGPASPVSRPLAHDATVSVPESVVILVMYLAAL